MVTASFNPDHIRHTGHRNRATRRDDRQIAFSHIACLQRLFRYFFNHVIGIPWIRNQMGVNATKKEEPPHGCQAGGKRNNGLNREIWVAVRPDWVGASMAAASRWSANTQTA